jgi:hypothetical protein
LLCVKIKETGKGGAIRPTAAGIAKAYGKYPWGTGPGGEPWGKCHGKMEE